MTPIQAGEAAQKIILDIFYIDVQGCIYCKSLLFALMVAKMLGEEAEHEKSNLLSYKYVIYPKGKNHY